MSFRRIALIVTALMAIFAMSVGLVGAQATSAAGKWTGEINATDASQLVVSGVRFQATGVQVDAGLSLAPGTVVQVKFSAANGSLNAVKVERLEAGDDDLPGTGRITGTIDSATADAVSIGGVLFTVVGATIDDDASLNAGSLVELRFTFNGTALTVSRIDAEDDENDAKAIGVIEAMDATTITVGGVAFDITGAQIDDEGVLAVGVLVKIEFTVADDGRVIALDVEFEDDDMFDDNDSNGDNNDDRNFSGVIEVMSTGAIIVSGQVFDITQAVIDDEGTLAVGVVVDIDYVTASDGRNVALEVEIEGGNDTSSDDSNNDDNFSADFVLSGNVEAIDGTRLTVNGITVDTNGANMDDDDTLDIGDAVTIYFQRDASGALIVIEVDEIDDVDDPFDDDRDDDDDNNDSDDSDDDNGSDDSSDDSSDDVTVVNGCVRPDSWQTYRVSRGDTLSRIAGAANTTVDALVAANCLTSANFITVGQPLFVPIRISSSDDNGSDDDNGGDDDNGDDDNGGNDDDGDDDDDNGGNDDDGDDDDGEDDDGDDDDGDDDDGDDGDDDDDDDDGDDD